mmetsp:Transcript_99392/g.310264  ORF Transcript_99392/g.310264 Transcript_99392/m.310264 type:complete len:294 (+) Transcript_99392:588-1469(+)
MHLYCVQCRTQVQELQGNLRAASALAPKESETVEQVAKQAEDVFKADYQRMMAEGVLLKAEIKRVEGNGNKALSVLRAEQTDLQLLESQLTYDVADAQARINATRMKHEELKRTLAITDGVEQGDLEQRKELEEQLNGLHERLSPVVYSAIRAENSAYRSELGQAMALLQSSKDQEARAAAAAQQATAEVDAQQQATEIASDAVREAESEGEKQLDGAVKAAAANKEQSQQAEARAEGVIADRCQPEWDVRGGEKDAELKKCRALKEELAVVKAQQDTLMQTLKAQQTANAAE